MRCSEGLFSFACHHCSVLQEFSFTPCSGSIFIPADSRINDCAQKKINCQKKFNSFVVLLFFVLCKLFFPPGLNGVLFRAPHGRPWKLKGVSSSQNLWRAKETVFLAWSYRNIPYVHIAWWTTKLLLLLQHWSHCYCCWHRTMQLLFLFLLFIYVPIYSWSVK